MKTAKVLLLVLFVAPCGNDKTAGVAIPTDLKLYENMVVPKIVGLSKSCVGFAVVRLSDSEYPIVYKIDRPRRGFMDSVTIEKWFQAPILGFDGNGFNQIMIPVQPNGEVVLYYHETDNDSKWKRCNLTEGVFNFMNSTPVETDVADIQAMKLKTYYDKWVNSID